MKVLKSVAAMIIMVSMVLQVQAFSQNIDTERWEEVLKSTEPVNIYVAKIANDSKNTVVSADTVTKIVKDMFATRRSTRFNVADDRAKADIVFSGKIIEYIWMEKAPITNIYSPGALALDVATKNMKNYARMQLKYEITDAKTDEVLLDEVTQVTIKKSKVPEDKSYEMIYKRTPKILSMDVFKRFKRDR